MSGRFLILLIVALLSYGCSADKHLPSSNPPEYDPKKVYTAPAAPPSAPATVAKSTQSTEFERLKAKVGAHPLRDNILEVLRNVFVQPPGSRASFLATAPSSALHPGIGIVFSSGCHRFY